MKIKEKNKKQIKSVSGKYRSRKNDGIHAGQPDYTVQRNGTGNKQKRKSFRRNQYLPLEAEVQITKQEAVHAGNEFIPDRHPKQSRWQRFIETMKFTYADVLGYDYENPPYF